MQVGDLAGGPGQLRAQLRRVQNLDLRPQREQVEHGGLSGVDPHPGLQPVAAAGRGRGAPPDPQRAEPPLQGGEPPATRRHPHPGPPATRQQALALPQAAARQFADEPVDELEATPRPRVA